MTYCIDTVAGVKVISVVHVSIGRPYWEKGQFSQERITFVEQMIDGWRLHTDPSKVSPIQIVGTPLNVSDTYYSVQEVTLSWLHPMILL